LRFVSVGQTLTVSVLAVSMECQWGDHEAQEFNPLRVEQALLGLECKSILAKAFQDTLDVNLMIFQGIGEDEDIV